MGLSDTELLDYNQLQALEPQTKIIAKGAIHFKCDAHLYPNKLMQQLLAHLQQVGVQIVKQTEVTGFEHAAGKITKVLQELKAFDADTVVMATLDVGLRELAATLKVKIPLMPGRGYSVTLVDSPYKINHPACTIRR